MGDISNTFVTFHFSVVVILTGIILTLLIWGIRCFRTGLNPAHRNVKVSYLTVLAIIWAFLGWVLL